MSRSGDRPGFNFSEPFIRRPVLTTMLVVLLVVLGVFGARRIPLDLFPNVEFPVVLVSVQYPGAAPQEVEALVTKPLESAIASAAGLESLRSFSMESLAWLVAEFKVEVDSRVAAADIRDKVASVRSRLPREIREPTFQLFDPLSEPIMSFSLSGQPPPRLSTLLEKVIKPRLETVPGVAAVPLVGDRQREIHLVLEPERLASFRLSLLGVFGALGQENFDMPAGKYTESGRDLSLRVMGKFRSLDEIERMNVPTPTGGHVRVRDLGTVADTVREPETDAILDGNPAVAFSVIKRSGANAVAVGDAVSERLGEIVPLLPPGVEIRTARDTSRFTRESNLSVWEHMAVGGLLAVAVLFLFLRSKAATLIGGLAIPLSVVGTFYLMDLAGFSFNVLTNLALSMVVGILVDDAVVDLENVYRHMEQGKEPIQAAIDATREIQLAVTATTLTIVAVFVPVGFMSGMVGKFFKEFGLTVAFAVLLSLLIARTVTPMLAARMLRVRSTREEGAEMAGATGFWLAPHYRRFLNWSLRHRGTVTTLALVAFLGGLALIPLIPKGFMTDADREEIAFSVRAPRGSALDATRRAALEVEAIARRQPEVVHVISTVGGVGDMEEASLYVELTPRHGRRRTDREIAQRIHDEAQRLPGIRTQVRSLGIAVMAGGQAFPINIQLRGDDLDRLARHAAKLVALLRRDPAFSDVDSTLAVERPELQLRIDRDRAAEAGVTPQALGQTLRLATVGDTTTTFTDGDFDYDIRVIAQPAVRTDLAAIRALTVPAAGRPPVAVGAVCDLVPGSGYPQINRRDRVRTVSVVANLRPGVPLGDAVGLARRAVEQAKLPPDIRVDYEGQSRNMREVFEGLGQALVLAILFIYVILAVQFESFVHPFTIMISLPLSVVGAFLALFASRTELGMMAMIGIIMLMGIVTKNAILIVDYTITLRQRGMARLDALLHAGPVRLRPILMTTAAMVMGMLPMAFRLGAGSEFRYPMAVVVIGGLLTSTLLTLVVVPVFYTLFDDLGSFFRGLFGWRESARTMRRKDAEADLAAAGG